MSKIIAGQSRSLPRRTIEDEDEDDDEYDSQTYLGIWVKFTNNMGDYKGRVNLRQRKRRFAKDQRIKALAATKKGTAPPAGANPQKSRESRGDELIAG